MRRLSAAGILPLPTFAASLRISAVMSSRAHCQCRNIGHEATEQPMRSSASASSVSGSGAETTCASGGGTVPSRWPRSVSAPASQSAWHVAIVAAVSPQRTAKLSGSSPK